MALRLDPAVQVPRPSRVRHAILFLASLVVSLLFLVVVAIVVTVVVWVVLAAMTAIPDPDRRVPRLGALAIVFLPVVAILLAFLISHRAEGRTFYAQKSANRWVSLLLMVTIVGLLVGIGEIIAAAVTFDAYGALGGAGLAAVAGVGAGAYAHYAGPGDVLASARAQLVGDAAMADGESGPTTARHRVLMDVVREISIAANVQPPKVYVIDDSSLNAMAVGTKPSNAAIAVTSGLLNSFDREQLQGVVAHELGHIRNLDSRYGVYLAIMVGLVALVSDGFLRMVIRGWQEGVFFRGAGGDDFKEMIAGLAAGVLFGLFLLLLAILLRIFAPLASILVQAAVSRQREYLADATSVELTRNPTGLARALAAIKSDDRPLQLRNRGSQHLWFDSPLGHDDDVGWHLFATHPTLDSRIARLGALYPQATTGAVAAETAEG